MNVSNEIQLDWCPLIRQMPDTEFLSIIDDSNVNYRDKRGWTIMHWAAWYGRTDVVRKLFDKGAKVSSTDEWGFQPLHRAAMGDHPNTAVELIKCKANVDCKDNDEMTPLHWASGNGMLEVVRTLLQNDSNVECRDKFQCTPLHRAAENNYLSVVQLLVQFKANTECENKDGMRPFHLALNGNCSDVFKWLLSQGVDITCKDKTGLGPIHMAAKKGNVDVIKQLLEKDQKLLESEDKEGRRPIHHAAMYGHLNVVKFLFQNKADLESKVNSDLKENSLHIGYTPLHYATLNGHLHVVQFMLNCGVDVNCTDIKATAPIHLAAGNGYIEIAKELVKKNSKIGCQNEYRWKPIHLASEAGYIEIVKFFLDEEDDAEDVDDQKMNCLHYAAKGGHVEIVEILLNADMNIESKAKSDWRPMHYAADAGHLSVVKFLKMKGADFESMDEWDMRPVHRAARKGHLDILEYLLECGAAIDCRDKDGWTTLDQAVDSGCLDVVKYLIDKGINVESEDNNKRRAIHQACERGYVDIVQFLLDKGCLIDVLDKLEYTPYDCAKEYQEDDKANYPGKLQVNHAKCAEILEVHKARRQNDEFQIFHFPTFSAICRKYKIYDMPNALEKIKKEISCINQPIVLCHLTETFRHLPLSLRVFRMVGKELQYPEYFVEDLQRNKEELQSRMSELRDWDVKATENTSTLEIKLEISRQTDPQKWSNSQYKTISLHLHSERLKLVNDTVHMLLIDGVKADDVKTIFIDFQRFDYFSKLLTTFDAQQTDIQEGIPWLHRWIMMQRQMLTFYQSNREKLTNSSLTIVADNGNYAKISVVWKAPTKSEFIPPLSESPWTKEFVYNLLSQEHILMRCITDDDVVWAVPRTNLVNAGDVKTRLQPYALGGRLLLVGPKGELSDDTGIDKIDSVIHYAVILPKPKMEKFRNIGRGGYGVVIKCKMANDDKLCAIKKMDICESDKPELIKSRINEVMVAARVGFHQNVINYRLFYENENSFCIVMDCMKESIYAFVKREYPLEEETIISFARQTLEGLKHLHDQKVIHRDIKCRNVLLDENNCAKLCDFGISKCQVGDTDRLATEGGYTQIGTYRYRAPELLDSSKPIKYGQMADMWAYGAMMVEMITGEVPYSGLNDVMAEKRISEDKKIEYNLLPKYSTQLKKFVDLCLVGEPQHRPTTAQLLQNVIFDGCSKNGQNGLNTTH